MRGLIIISLPKSGTMFLSSYLSSITGYNSKFGLFETDFKTLFQQIPVRSDPLIQKNMTRGSPTSRIMAKRYLQMLNRKRGVKNQNPMQSLYSAVQTPDTQWIIADHGFDNFLVFLRNPCDVKILRPETILVEAERLHMGVLFLYRNLGAVIYSLAHFIASGKSFLIKCKPLEVALEIALNKYAPVIAKQTRIWKNEFKNGLIISYEELNRHTRDTINRVCQFYNLPLKDHRLISSMNQFKAWTFRKGDPDAWETCMTLKQRVFLDRFYSDLIHTS